MLRKNLRRRHAENGVPCVGMSRTFCPANCATPCACLQERESKAENNAQVYRLIYIQAEFHGLLPSDCYGVPWGRLGTPKQTAKHKPKPCPASYFEPLSICPADRQGVARECSGMQHVYPGSSGRVVNMGCAPGFVFPKVICLANA
jgi:hypothetical protein